MAENTLNQKETENKEHKEHKEVRHENNANNFRKDGNKNPASHNKQASNEQAANANAQDGNNQQNHGSKRPSSRRLNRSTGPVLAEKVIEIKRISKTTKGGRHMRFSALVVVGDKKGTIGYGLAKANEVPDALKKAIKKANNNLVKVKMTKRGSLFHEVTGHSSSGEVLLKPAPEGTGIIAGGPIRAVIELAGYSDIYSKNKGTNSSINMVRATINGLLMQKTAKNVAEARDLPLNKIFH